MSLRGVMLVEFWHDKDQIPKPNRRQEQEYRVIFQDQISRTKFQSLIGDKKLTVDGIEVDGIEVDGIEVDGIEVDGIEVGGVEVGGVEEQKYLRD
ncbi:hypothetical protein EG327_004398 [Venturia inaequalis]|uniref:Uncharacterized protein n=1 Tax=Venturia inaequalis TaxID=5025 RepID=A0A8H3Z5N0_VENIN|nr:hypothetical protein EG327_004398 [Venturia inaequalis]